MVKRIELNTEDIKELVAREYKIDPKSIKLTCYTESQDGPYH